MKRVGLYFFSFRIAMQTASFRAKEKTAEAIFNFISTRERAAWLLSPGIFILRFCLVVVVQKDAKRQLCFLTGGLDVPASVVVCRDRSVDLDHEFGNPTFIEAVDLAGFIIVLYPVVAGCLFVLVSRIRNSDGSFAPHGLGLLHRHLECRDQGMLVASEVGAAFLDSYDSVQRAAEVFELCDGFDEA